MSNNSQSNLVSFCDEEQERGSLMILETMEETTEERSRGVEQRCCHSQTYFASLFGNKRCADYTEKRMPEKQDPLRRAHSHKHLNPNTQIGKEKER